MTSVIPKNPFGRRKAIDPKDKDYPLRRLINLEDVPIARERPWNAPPPLDQGNTGIPGRESEGSCTGHAGAHFLAAAPHMHVLNSIFAVELYDGARKNDEWFGEDYDGSSVRGLMKYMMLKGLIKGGYLWAFTAETIRDYVLRYGPVIAGTDWYTDMMETDKAGYIKPTGAMEGGHAYVILGHSPTRNAFRIQNSWSEEWGQGGRAWIQYDYMQFLIEQDGGEAVSAVEIKLAA